MACDGGEEIGEGDIRGERGERYGYHLIRAFLINVFMTKGNNLSSGTCKLERNRCNYIIKYIPQREFSKI